MTDDLDIPPFLKRAKLPKAERPDYNRPLYNNRRTKLSAPVKPKTAKPVISEGRKAILRDFGYTLAQIKMLRPAHAAKIVDNNIAPHVWFKKEDGG